MLVGVAYRSPPIDHDQPCKRCLETERNVEELSEENKRLRKEIKCVGSIYIVNDHDSIKSF